MLEKINEKIAIFMGMSMRDRCILIFPYLMVMLVCCRIAELYRLCEGNLIKIIKNMEYLYKSIPSFMLSDLLIGIAVGYFIIWYVKWNHKMHRKNTRKGEEYGGARWGTPEEIKPFIDPDPFNNLILSKTEFLSMKPRMPQFKLNRNKHVVVYGSSSAGKTFGIVKPNMMQLHGSYVVTDPNG